MLFQKKKILAALLLLLVFAGCLAGYGRFVKNQKELAAKKQEALREEAKEEEERIRRKKVREITNQARQIAQALSQAGSEEAVLADAHSAAKAARRAQEQAERFRMDYAQEEEAFTREAYGILEETSQLAQSILQMEEAKERLAQIYDEEKDSVAMNTAKNDRIFREAQRLIWQTPESYPKTLESFQKAIDRISGEWDYVNDRWHYETSSLKVSVEELETSYTRYWVCHVQTFSPAQLCSALCGGTYGNPRVTVSEELAAHNGVIGVNGSGFSYGSGEPAPGKTMIKGGKIYADLPSNGNIFCVTGDGGMFTATAGLTARQLQKRNVKDTYCFGPTLVEGGEKYPISGDFQQTYRYQRTAVGMVNPGEYYLVAVQGGGAKGSKGMTYEELQEVFLDLGCDYAYNLDGGGSTTLVFKGRILNVLTDAAGERPCGDILYFIDAGDGHEGEDILVHEEEAMLLP